MKFWHQKDWKCKELNIKGIHDQPTIDYRSITRACFCIQDNIIQLNWEPVSEDSYKFSSPILVVSFLLRERNIFMVAILSEKPSVFHCVCIKGPDAMRQLLRLTGRLFPFTLAIEQNLCLALDRQVKSLNFIVETLIHKE